MTLIGELEAFLDQHILRKTLKPDERWCSIIALIVTKFDSGGFDLYFFVSGRRLTNGWKTPMRNMTENMIENGVDGGVEGER